MLVLGLTGQSGAGKGEFSRVIDEYESVCVLDTDRTSRQVVCKGQPCLKELTDFFGCEILCSDGTLNRKRLAEIAFSDEKKHLELNRITHFHIVQKIKQWLEICVKDNVKCAVIDAPLLFESGVDSLCHITLGIIAPYEQRLERIITRDGLDEKNARLRLDSQPADSFFRERCTYILENNGDLREFEEKARTFIQSVILSKA